MRSRSRLFISKRPKSRRCCTTFTNYKGINGALNLAHFGRFSAILDMFTGVLIHIKRSHLFDLKKNKQRKQNSKYIFHFFLFRRIVLKVNFSCFSKRFARRRVLFLAGFQFREGFLLLQLKCDPNSFRNARNCGDAAQRLQRFVHWEVNILGGNFSLQICRASSEFPRASPYQNHVGFLQKIFFLTHFFS
jgi:hypothetical protein